MIGNFIFSNSFLLSSELFLSGFRDGHLGAKKYEKQWFRVCKTTVAGEVVLPPVVLQGGVYSYILTITSLDE